MHHVGIDVGKNTCAIAVINDDGDLTHEFEISNGPDGFDDLTDRLKGAAQFALEACSYGFPIHDHLVAQGFEVTVAHPRKVHLITENESKTDWNDARILADLLRVGYLPEAYLPTQGVLRIRDIARDRREVGEEMTRWKTRIRSMLDSHGVEIPFQGRALWSQEGLAWLEDGVFFGDERDELLNARVLQLRALQERKRVLEPMLAGLALEDERAQWLMSIPGCRWYLAMFILGEVGTIHRFHSKDAFKKYCGCCPQEKSTGGRQDPFGVVQHAHKDLKWAIHQIAQHLHTRENPVGDAYRARVTETGDHGSGMTIARREVCELVYDLLMVEEPCNWAAPSVLENKVARARAKA